MSATIKDSGKREEFPTGSRRDARDGKGRFDLIPPEVLLRLAKHFEAGAAKYGDRNWQKGQPLSRYLDSALRHLNCWQRGLDDEPHLTAALWNIVAMLWTEEKAAAGTLPAELLDAGPLQTTEA